MPTEEQDMNILRAQKRSAVEREVENSELFKKIKQTLSNFDGISIEISEVVDAYMDIYSGESTLIADSQTPNFGISIESIDEVLRGAIYSISKEENGLVLDGNGNVDIEGTIQCRLAAQYNYVSGLESLSPAEQRELISAIGADLEIEKFGDVFIDHQIEVSNTFSINDSSLTDLDREYWNDIMNNFMTTSDVSEKAIEYVGKKFEEAETVEKIEKGRNKQFLQAGTGEIEYMRDIFVFNGDFPEEEKAKALENLKNSDYVKREFDLLPNGEIDLKEMSRDLLEWMQAYNNDTRINILESFKNEYFPNPPKFDKIPEEERILVLRSAVLLAQDKTADSEQKKIARETLKGLFPDSVQNLRDENGEIIKDKFKIIYEPIINAYNLGKPEGEQVKNKEELRKIFSEEEIAETYEHLEDLVEKDKKGLLKSEAEYMERRDRKKKSLQERANDTRKAKSRKPKLIVKDFQERLGIKLDETLSEITDKNGNEIGFERKVNTVMATYKRLKESTKFRNRYR